MRVLLRLIATASGVLMLSACGDNATGTCAMLPSLGIRLHVRDTQTGGSLDAVAVAKIVRTTAPRDSMTGRPADAVVLTSHQPGTYTVTVSVPGYTPATREVIVPPITGWCASVETQEVTVRLSALPPDAKHHGA